MVNKVILIGNLGRDPEVRRLDSGGYVARFPIATNENYQDKNGEWQQITDWHNIVVWGKSAERAEKSLRKGYTVFIEGKLRTRKWQDNEGKDRYTTEVNALSYKIIDRKEHSEAPDYSTEKNTSVEQQVSNPTPNTEHNNPSVDEQKDDLPF